MNRSPFLTAIFNPVNLVMLSLVVISGLCAAWWLAPLGLILWIVMVVVIARDPGINITFTRQNRQPLAQRYEIRFDRLERSRISIFNAMAQVNPQMHRIVQSLQDDLAELVEVAYQLCLRMSALENHYAVQRLNSDIELEIKKLESKLEKTDDVAARQEYQQTVQALKDREGHLKSLATLLDRFEAQMTGTNNTVDGIVTTVVNLKGSSLSQTKEKVPSLQAIIQTERNELNEFDQQSKQFSFIK
jgi:hypothetical protein